MNIPDEVIEAAAKAQYEWQDGLPSWENDADGFTKAEYVSQTGAAAQVVAVWARKEALREATEAVRRNAGDEDENGICEGVNNWPDASARTYSFATHEAIEAIRALAEGVSDGQQ